MGGVNRIGGSGANEVLGRDAQGSKCYRIVVKEGAMPRCVRHLITRTFLRGPRGLPRMSRVGNGEDSGETRGLE